MAFIIDDVTRDPLIKRIDKEARSREVGWGEQAPYSLEIFDGILDRPNIEIVLQQAGFEETDKMSKIDEARKDGTFELGSEIYVGQISRLPCAETYYVFLWFDDVDMLTAVKFAQFEAGCL